MSTIFKILLLPISIIYGLITKCRNYFFDKGILKSEHFEEIKTIVVGNLSVGGTGKTPHVEYVTKLLKSSFSVAILSRGYGRKTKGYLQADKESSFKTIGDEPMQYFLKYKEEVGVFVAEKRVIGLTHIIANKKKYDIVVLDDAYQHRYVKADFYITLTDFSHLFYKDLVLPSGRLREFKSGIKRSDVVVVTKCPETISKIDMEHIKNKIISYGIKDVFFTQIKYGSLISLFDYKIPIKGSKIAVLTGIANPSSLLTYLSSKFSIAHHFEYADHHHFSEKDIKQVISLFNKSSFDAIITTEKDAVRLKEFEALREINIFYQSIEVDFIFEKESFDYKINQVI